MLLYLLKSGVCLAVFYGFYKLLLEKESIHTFKRYYLLASVVVAFTIPFITFTEYIEAIPQNVPSFYSDVPLTNTVIEAEPINYLPIILWAIYGLGVLLFSIKFFKNLSQLLYKIKHNTKVKIDQITNVLLQDLIVPHTFFNYIFLNKHKFEAHQIPKEILLHEETHAKQKHSLDVLFIEIIHILFWFNPLIYFIKHSIKLNHEFLADHDVLKQGIASSTYQNILLAFSSNAIEPPLANAINYSSIKKRFTVMKTQTSKQAFWLRSLFLLPLLAILIYSFSEKQVVEKPQGLQIANGEIKMRITKDRKVIIGNETFDFDLLSDKLLMLTKNDKNKPSLFIEIEGHLDTAELEDITNEIKKTKLIISEINANSIHLDENAKIVNDYFKGIFTAKTIVLKNKKGELMKGTTGPQIVGDTLKIPSNNEDYDLITIKLPKNRGRNLNSNDLEKLDEFVKETFYEKNQQKATPKEIQEYNELAKKFNSNPKGVFKEKDIKRVIELYNLMSDEQKSNAEPLPNMAPPPPLPDNATAEQKANYEKAYANYKKLTQDLKKQDASDIPPPPPPVEKETDDHTKEALEARKKFFEKANTYGEAMHVYFKEKKGDLADLKKQYKEVMELYNSYQKLLEKENVLPPPPPPPVKN